MFGGRASTTTNDGDIATVPSPGARPRGGVRPSPWPHAASARESTPATRHPESGPGMGGGERAGPMEEGENGGKPQKTPLGSSVTSFGARRPRRSGGAHEPGLQRESHPSRAHRPRNLRPGLGFGKAGMGRFERGGEERRRKSEGNAPPRTAGPRSGPSKRLSTGLPELANGRRRVGGAVGAQQGRKLGAPRKGWRGRGWSFFSLSPGVGGSFF